MRVLNSKGLPDSVHIAKLSLLHCYQGPWDTTSPTAVIICSLIGRASRTAGFEVPAVLQKLTENSGSVAWLSDLMNELYYNVVHSGG